MQVRQSLVQLHLGCSTLTLRGTAVQAPKVNLQGPNLGQKLGFTPKKLRNLESLTTRFGNVYDLNRSKLWRACSCSDQLTLSSKGPIDPQPLAQILQSSLQWSVIKNQCTFDLGGLCFAFGLLTIHLCASVCGCKSAALHLYT